MVWLIVLVLLVALVVAASNTAERQSVPGQCRECGLVNRPSALRCDCGYRFVTPVTSPHRGNAEAADERPAVNPFADPEKVDALHEEAKALLKSGLALLEKSPAEAVYLFDRALRRSWEALLTQVGGPYSEMASLGDENSADVFRDRLILWCEKAGELLLTTHHAAVCGTIMDGVATSRRDERVTVDWPDWVGVRELLSREVEVLGERVFPKYIESVDVARNKIVKMGMCCFQSKLFEKPRLERFEDMVAMCGELSDAYIAIASGYFIFDTGLWLHAEKTRKAARV